MNVLLQYISILSNDNCYIKILLYHILNVYKKEKIYMWWLTEKMINFILFNNYLICIYILIYSMYRIESNIRKTLTI